MLDFGRSFCPKQKIVDINILKHFTQTILLNIQDGDTQSLPFGYRGNFKIKEAKKNYKIEGSIHSFYNDYILKNGKRNTNDFSFSGIKKTIDNLAKEFNINWSDTRLTELEFGFNFEVKKPISEYIDTIKLHKNDTATSFEDSTTRNSKFFHKTNFDIKIYDKAKHCKLDSNILRIEMRFRSKELKPLGIYNWNDLKDKTKLTNLFYLYKKRFNELLIVDDFYDLDLNSKDMKLLYGGCSYSYWKWLRKKSNTTVINHKNKLKALIIKYDLNTTQIELNKLIDEKFEFLINS